MDFGQLLHMARKNSENVKNTESKFYSTKFSAPKKETKEKKLSDNIKKFLAKKEQEEKEKARIEKEKLAKLLALRDEKSKNKIRKMLKVTKSANKSVLADAIDNENTAVTLQGPDQPDEDDYGYVSQEAAAFYQKYMDKVKSLPEQNKFSPSRATIKTDLSGTKDRVKEAIRKEQEEKANPHRTKLPSSKASLSQTETSSHSSSRKKDLYDPEAEIEREKEEQRRKEEERKKKQLKKPAPPPMDFKELLRLAEKKQHEPVEIEVEVEKEPERLLTKKQKKELEERKAYLEGRNKKETGNINNKMPIPNEKTSKTSGAPSDSRKSSLLNDKIPSKSLKKSSSTDDNSATVSQSGLKSNNSSFVSKPKQSHNIKLNRTEVGEIKEKTIDNNNTITKHNVKPINGQVSSKSSISSSSKLNTTKQVSALGSSSQKSTNTSVVAKSTSNFPNQQKQYAQKNSIRDKKLISSSINSKDIKSSSYSSHLNKERETIRQFPPPDVRSNRPVMKKPIKRPRIEDDDEYDSELDDFIDDGPEDEGQNYSAIIKDIFGYDKSRYRDIDDDDPNMESSFVQQMKEEQISKRIGIKEDLEDMRLEAEEKRRKALIKKKKLK